jgi:hypothetical protein
MVRKRPVVLVVDASVLRAAGESSRGWSSACRGFLDQILEICHHVVVCGELRKEWRRHRSIVGSIWLKSMYAHNKVDRVEPGPVRSLEKRIGSVGFTTTEQTLVEKDLHLVQIALTTRAPIVSLDERARALFTRLAGRVVEIRNVVWVNPVAEGEDASSWVRAGCPNERGRCLGYQ